MQKRFIDLTPKLPIIPFGQRVQKTQPEPNFNAGSVSFEGKSNIRASLPITEDVKLYDMKNTSGGSLALGSVVILNSVASGQEVTTTTTGGDNKVFGVYYEIVPSNAYGRVAVLGFAKVRVDGTTDIAIGDYLTPFTSAGIAQKAAAGNMIFAMALAAYTANDSLGLIDCLVLSPRLI